MGHILLYSRKAAKEPTAEQSINILSEQLQLVGHQVDISHSLNIPRLILNSYDAVHVVVEELPLTANEALHLGICKALGKSTLISILNSDRNLKRGFLNFVKPDALSVSQTNHFKYYRNISANKFVFPALPHLDSQVKKADYSHQSYLLPVIENLEEAFEIVLTGEVYIDGRLLVATQGTSNLRKKWNDYAASGKIGENYHLVLSENKINELLNDQSVCLILADSRISHCQFTHWLGQVFNRRNFVVLNEFQATGFSSYWTSGRNCFVVPHTNWRNSVRHLDMQSRLQCTHSKPGELFEAVVNELSRLYSKLHQQKTSLLTSRSVKL